MGKATLDWKCLEARAFAVLIPGRATQKKGCRGNPGLLGRAEGSA